MLELRRLRALHAVATHGTVTAAAASLGYTPPAVSQQLTALTREVGVPLLVRDGRRLQLTEAGWRLVAHTEVVLQHMEAMEADLLSTEHAPAGQVRLAAFASALIAMVPRAIRRLAIDAPQVELTLEGMEPDEAEQALHRRHVDLALVHDYDLVPRPPAVGFERRELSTESVWVVLPAGHPAMAEHVDLGLLADQAWLVPSEGNACHDLVLRACGAAGFVPRIVARSTDFQALLALAAAGLGVALVPEAALFHLPPGLQLCKPNPSIRRNVFALTTPGRVCQPAVAAVLLALAEVAQSASSERAR